MVPAGALSMRPLATGTVLLAATLALAACGEGGIFDFQQEDAMSAEQMAFKQNEQQWREKRRADLLSEEGWTSLVGLHWITPGPHFMGSDTDNGIRLAVGPDHLGMIDLRSDGRIRFVPERGVRVSVDGVPLARQAWLRTDAHPQGASRLEFDGGRGVATVIVRNDRHALRVWHQDAPTRVGFGSLGYWPADPDWVVQARFEAHPEPRTLEVANIIGGFDAMPNPGVVVFERDGAEHRLEALDGGEQLFLVFADGTNGHGSYGAGRFLYVPRPDAGGRLEVNFNRAYSPPCAFTPFATCPLPPDQNRLALAVTAGEKAYQPPGS